LSKTLPGLLTPNAPSLTIIAAPLCDNHCISPSLPLVLFPQPLFPKGEGRKGIVGLAIEARTVLLATGVGAM
jgi:hypothetical protein